jgi:hypothetical protein
MSVKLHLSLQREEYGLRVAWSKALRKDKEEDGIELHIIHIITEAIELRRTTHARY